VGATTNTSGGGNLSDFALERFTANGTPDKTFGRKGLVTPDMPTGVEGGEAFNAAVVQPDGKIVAAGSVGTGGRTGHSNVVLARYHPGGTPDLLRQRRHGDRRPGWRGGARPGRGQRHLHPPGLR